MTTPCTGCITLADVAAELGADADCLSLNDTAVRELAKKPTGCIGLDDLRCKSALTIEPVYYCGTEIENPNGTEQEIYWDAGKGVPSGPNQSTFVGATLAGQEVIACTLTLIEGVCCFPDVQPAWPQPWGSAPAAWITPGNNIGRVGFKFDKVLTGRLEITLFDIDSGDDVYDYNVTPDYVGPYGNEIEVPVVWNNFNGDYIEFTISNQAGWVGFAINGTQTMTFYTYKKEQGTRGVRKDGSIAWVKDKDGNPLDPSAVVPSTWVCPA